MPIEPKAGEVLWAELGTIERSRPVLLMSVPDAASSRALVTVAPLTSEIRRGPDEVYLGKPRWLMKECAVNV